MLWDLSFVSWLMCLMVRLSFTAEINPEMKQRQGVLLWLVLTVLMSSVHLWYYHWHFGLYYKLPPTNLSQTFGI